MPPQAHGIRAGEAVDYSMPSPTKRLAVATNSGLCHDERGHSPDYDNHLEDVKQSKLLLTSPEILPEKHH
ncbi:hypothetical protein OSTOST_15301, partial [Ostertagia ostertagi]